MKYLNVELIPTLSRLAKTRFGEDHVDFDMDAKVLHRTGKGVWVWILCDEGTWLFPMVSCLCESHFAYHVIEHYAEQNQLGTYVFIIECNGNKYGDIYDLKLKKFYKLLQENCIRANSRFRKYEFHIAFRMISKVYKSTKNGQVESRVTGIQKEMKIHNMKRRALRMLDKYYLEHYGEDMFDQWWPDPDEYTWIFNRGAKTIKLVYNPEIDEVEVTELA